MTSVTNRVFLPNGQKIYVSDDVYGDDRLEQIFSEYGNLKLEACYKVLGTSLDDLPAFWSGTIIEFFN